MLEVIMQDWITASVFAFGWCCTVLLVGSFIAGFLRSWRRTRRPRTKNLTRADVIRLELQAKRDEEAKEKAEKRAKESKYKEICNHIAVMLDDSEEPFQALDSVYKLEQTSKRWLLYKNPYIPHPELVMSVSEVQRVLDYLLEPVKQDGELSVSEEGAK